jgi:hypothetical protein
MVHMAPECISKGVLNQIPCQKILIFAIFSGERSICSSHFATIGFADAASEIFTTFLRRRRTRIFIIITARDHTLKVSGRTRSASWKAKPFDEHSVAGAPFKPWQRTLLTVAACVGTTCSPPR